VYARVSRAVKGEDVELEGFNSATGKSEGMGQLKGGMVFEVSPAFARRLMMGKKGGVGILDGVGEKIRFEVAVGRNGRVWVDSGNVRTTASIGKLLTDSDENAWSEEDQEKALKKALKDMS
jgi:exosome complex component RRP40